MQTYRHSSFKTSAFTFNDQHEVSFSLFLAEAFDAYFHYFSVIGIIAIPGTMTGAILGGSSVHQAAKLQMIIMFMIAASAVLASVSITYAAIIMVVDQEHRNRSDRIYKNKPVIYRVKVRELLASLSRSFNSWTIKSQTAGGELDLEENEKLLMT